MNYVTITFDIKNPEDGYVMETDISEDTAFVLIREAIDNRITGKCECKPQRRHKCSRDKNRG